jgi:uncharacterized protein (TIGR02186 family)
MRHALLGLALSLLMCATARAQPFAAAITQDVVEVTSRFTGATVTVFGAVNDQRGPTLAGNLDVVVAVASAPVTVTVRRQKRIMGFWFPADPVRFAGAPAFLSTLSARPLNDITDPATQLRLGLDPADGAPWVVNQAAGGDVTEYRAALKRLKAADGLYVLDPHGVDFPRPGLFRAKVVLPANAPTGVYRVEAFLFRDGRLIGRDTSLLQVTKVGFERAVWRFAHERPLLYGLASILIALGAGLAAARVFTQR